MAELIDVSSQVALAALLDTSCLEQAIDDAALPSGDLLAGDGAAELLASHPTVSRLVMAAIRPVRSSQMMDTSALLAMAAPR